jgi:hypothetical protein
MRMKIARVLPLFLVLTLAFAAAGCPVPVEDGDLTAEEARAQIVLTPEELLEKVVEAYQRVVTYHVDMETTEEKKIPPRGEIIEPIQLSWQMSSDSRVDVTKQRMRSKIMETRIRRVGGVLEDVTEIEMEAYWVDGLVYVNIPMIPGEPPTMWMKGEMPWECLLQPTIDLLKTSEIDILGIEGINDLESYLIKVTPDLGNLWEFLDEAMMGPGMPPVRGIDLEKLFEEVSMKKWIARDTFHVVKQQLCLTMAFEGMEMKMSSIARYHSFNEPVAIELPPEAEEAAIWGPGAPPPP